MGKPRRWNSIESVDGEIKTIFKIIKQTGALPETLVYSYMIMIDSVAPSKPGLVAHFYEGIAKYCPEALEYFK